MPLLLEYLFCATFFFLFFFYLLLIHNTLDFVALAGETKQRVEAILGLSNFARDQRDLAMNHYKRDRRSDTMRPETIKAVKVEARCATPAKKTSLPSMFRDLKPVRQGGWPIYRGFYLAQKRPDAI